MSFCLTIVTLTKDDPPGLARTLDSAAAWRVRGDVEHIVVFAGDRPSLADDASLTMHQQVSLGIAGAFNEGLARARGEWVWFLNGGDAIHESLNPEWLLALLAQSQAEIVVGGIHYDGDDIARFAPPLSRQWPLLECWLPHPATLVRRETVLRMSGFDVRYAIAADYDLWFRLLRGGARVDTVSIPFARFDITGLSQRSDMRQVVCREEASVILRRSWHLLNEGRRLAGRIAYRLLWALRHWKPIPKKPPHGNG